MVDTHHLFACIEITVDEVNCTPQGWVVEGILRGGKQIRFAINPPSWAGIQIYTACKCILVVSTNMARFCPTEFRSAVATVDLAVAKEIVEASRLGCP